MSKAGGSSLLMVKNIEGKGRGFVASQPLKAGQIVIRESPILLYSTLPLFLGSSSTSYCDHCFRVLPKSTPESNLPSNTVVPCPFCSACFFCNSRCLSLALKSSHSSWACQALSILRECTSPLFDYELQVQARFVVAAYNLALLSASDLQNFLNLHGTPDAAQTSAAEFIHSLLSSICPPELSVDLTAKMIAKESNNSFCLMQPFSSDDPKRSTRACGVYPMSSFFNHSCLPNASRFDYVDTSDPQDEHNTDIIIRMIHDVPEGEEILISYFHVYRSYANRQKILIRDYGFTCHCIRCKDEASLSDSEDLESSPHAYFFSMYMCSRPNCWGTLAPLPPEDHKPSTVMECNFCGTLREGNMSGSISMGRQSIVGSRS